MVASTSLTSLPLPRVMLDSIAPKAPNPIAPPLEDDLALVLAVDLISTSPPVDSNFVPFTKAFSRMPILAVAPLPTTPTIPPETPAVRVLSMLAMESA